MEGGFVIRIVADALTDVCPPEPTFLKHYSPNGNGGAGFMAFTTDVRKASNFPTQVAAIECWGQISETHPLRIDGLPNRPLSAYTIGIMTTSAAIGLAAAAAAGDG